MAGGRDGSAGRRWECGKEEKSSERERSSRSLGFERMFWFLRFAWSPGPLFPPEWVTTFLRSRRSSSVSFLWIRFLQNSRAVPTLRGLRLIVYHHDLHMWYRVVCIGSMGGIGVLLEVLSRWHKRNI
jgi:hypothetical protein